MISQIHGHIQSQIFPYLLQGKIIQGTYIFFIVVSDIIDNLFKIIFPLVTLNYASVYPEKYFLRHTHKKLDSLTNLEGNYNKSSFISVAFENRCF